MLRHETSQTAPSGVVVDCHAAVFSQARYTTNTQSSSHLTARILLLLLFFYERSTKASDFYNYAQHTEEKHKLHEPLVIITLLLAEVLRK